jgi:hypothetical protein
MANRLMEESGYEHDNTAYYNKEGKPAEMSEADV